MICFVVFKPEYAVPSFGFAEGILYKFFDPISAAAELSWNPFYKPYRICSRN
jgi:hypothetical protein